MKTKEFLIDFVSDLPDDITLADAVEKLQILVAIKEGQADIAAGHFSTHDDMQREMASWSTKSSGRAVPDGT